MADLLENAACWLADQRVKFASRIVTYQRGDKNVAMPATLGTSRFEVESASGLTEMFESRDFLVRAADLVLDGQMISPKRGDRIIDGALVYEVLAPAGDTCWRWSDPHRIGMRIYTKQIEAR